MSPRVCFADGAFAPVEIPEGVGLAERLTVRNSPVLFGCRTGICGTCLSRVHGEIAPPEADEREMLDLLAPGVADARLLCQLRLHGTLTLVVYLG